MQLPYLTHDLPPLGGMIKYSAEDFIVEEVPSYPASGNGQHIYLTLRRQNLNTDDVIKILKRRFEIPEKEIGKAGLKDKLATTTQVFSLSLGANYPLEKVREVLAAESMIEVLKVERHLNKIKTGHLLGNRFTIKIRQIKGDEPTIIKIVERLKNGIPNFFGEQRFGSKGDNAAQGLRILKGEKSMNHHMEKLMLSSLQSELFNQYLIKRMAEDQLFQQLPGDVVIYDQVTGPLFGDKMLTPSERPKEWEDQVLQESGLTAELFSHPLLPGGRRPILLVPQELCYRLEADFLELKFFLPKGGYATQLTREFIKDSAQ